MFSPGVAGLMRRKTETLRPHPSTGSGECGRNRTLPPPAPMTRCQWSTLSTVWRAGSIGISSKICFSVPKSTTISGTCRCLHIYIHTYIHSFIARILNFGSGNSLLYNWSRTKSFVQTLSAQIVWNTWVSVVKSYQITCFQYY
jgi:hypothetical protein